MTTPTNTARPSRAERKAALLLELEQQRVDILVDSDYLLNAAQPLENSLKSFKLPLFAIGGIAAWRLVRHPGGAMAAGRKALAGYMLFRKFKLLAKIAT
ncbi:MULTISPECIES: YqjK-like family protein [unclassified Halomonas]|uniref:YqjK-like family protein n=1 Tax=unclassified Halomonas TaxID=2609666 RepID=UPI0021E4C450|nr:MULTISPECIES: YqjK-like family protein [unclassified Halomonas]UYG01051.1 YqjK-like family protein [Halomonas sp. GD1P12]WNL37887.1 YqjK-like family protein [Halomonas sp. PAMB 3232]WNL41203.1 YqjK-like family protein [Halomonas sp. PAMB 3264]